MKALRELLDSAEYLLRTSSFHQIC